MALAVNDTNFNEVINGDKPVLADFWATWCGQCRMISPIIAELATEYDGTADVAKCNVDAAGDVTMQYGIRNIPTLLFFQNGKLKDKLVGSTTKAAIVEKLNALL